MYNVFVFDTHKKLQRLPKMAHNGCVGRRTEAQMNTEKPHKDRKPVVLSTYRSLEARRRTPRVRLARQYHVRARAQLLSHARL